MKIVIPIAGRDERYTKHFKKPKPLIPVGKTILLKHTFDTLGFDYENDFSEIIFICHPDDEKEYGITAELKQYFPYSNVSYHILAGSTEGAACTVLTVKEKIDSDEPLIVYLADIIFKPEKPFKEVIHTLPESVDGLIPCFPSSHAKYSYAEEEEGRILHVAEKEVISNNASAGIYFFRRGQDFIHAAETMIQDNTKRVNDAFYICPVYNELIDVGKRVAIHPVDFVVDLGHFEAVTALS